MRSKVCTRGQLKRPGKCQFRFWDPFTESPETFWALKAIAKRVSNLTITELFQSHIRNMKRGSIHTRSFRGKQFLDSDELKVVLRAGKVSGAFEKRPPGQFSKMTHN